MRQSPTATTASMPPQSAQLQCMLHVGTYYSRYRTKNRSNTVSPPLASSFPAPSTSGFLEPRTSSSVLKTLFGYPSMLFHYLERWAPFRIDALGLVTLLGAERVDQVVGRLAHHRLTSCLPLLGAF